MGRWRQLLAMVTVAALTVVLAPTAATATDDVLEISGPTSVAGGEAFTVTFTVTDGGQPVQGRVLDVKRYRYADHETWDHLDATTLLTTDSTGAATIDMTAGAVDWYQFEVGAVSHRVEVSRQPTTLTLADPGSVVPGETVSVSAVLLGDGGPMVGEPVTFAVSSAAGGKATYTATTDGEGAARVVLVDEEVGDYLIRASWAGTTLLDDAVDAVYLYRGPDPSTLTVTGPAEGAAHEPVTISGGLTPAYGGEVIRIQRPWSSEPALEATTDADGDWSAQVVPDPGWNEWTVSFAGDDRVQAASATYVLETLRTATSFDGVVLDGPAAGDGYRLTGRLVGDSGYAQVSLSWDGGEARQFSTGADGSFDLLDTAPPTAGIHTLRLEFDGDARGLPSSAEYDVLVGKGHPGFHVSFEPNPDPGKAFLAEGRLDYQSTQSTHVVVTDPAGERSRVPVRIEDSHEFNIPLRAPDTPGTNATWTIRFPGDVDHVPQTVEFTALVRSPYPVTLSEPQGVATVGGDVDLEIDFGAGSPDMKVVARRPDGSVAWRRAGTAYFGSIDVVETIDSALEVTVTVEEDDYHYRTRRTYVVRPFRALSTRLGGQHTDDSGVAVYAASATPRITSTVRPAPGCVVQRVQVRASGTWRTVSDDCVRVGRRDVAGAVFDRDGDRHRSYRVRSEVSGSGWYRATSSPWERFRFGG